MGGTKKYHPSLFFRFYFSPQPVFPLNSHSGDKLGIEGDKQQRARIIGQHLSEQLARGVIQVIIRLIEEQQLRLLCQYHQEAQLQPLTTTQLVGRLRGASGPRI